MPRTCAPEFPGRTTRTNNSGIFLDAALVALEQRRRTPCMREVTTHGQPALLGRRYARSHENSICGETFG